MTTHAWRHLASPLLGLLLAIVTLAVFWPGLTGGFLFDDYPNLLLDNTWRIDSIEPAQLLRSLSHGGAGPLGRPLALLSLGLNYYLTGLDPFWLKLGNLALHLLNGLLVFGLCRMLFARLPGPGVRAGSGRPGMFAAAAVSLAWLLHPVQVSSVMYVVQRMEIGATTGVLLALCAYVRARERQFAGGRAWPWLVMAAAGIAMGLGFKESAILGFGFAFLIELMIFRFAGAGKTISHGWVAAYGLSLIGAVAVFLRYIVPMAAPDGLYAIRDFTMGERLLTQLPILTLYLKQMLLPWPESLTFYYDNYPISRGLFAPPATVIGACALLLLLGVALACWRRWALTALGIGWFFVAHTLTSNIIPLELAFEHRNYLALLGVTLAFVQPLSWLASRLQLESDARMAMALLPIAGLAALCAIQGATWGDRTLLATTLENRNPDSPRASYDLAKEYLNLSGDDVANPLWSMSLKQFAIAASLPGASALPMQGVILMQARKGLSTTHEQWEQFRIALSRTIIGPEGLSALHTVSTCRIENRCVLDDQQLLTTFLAVLEKNPESAAVHTLYGNFAWNVLNDRDLAIQTQREAVKLSPTTPGYRVALAKFLLASNLRENRAQAEILILQLKGENLDGSLNADIADLISLGSAGVDDRLHGPKTAG